MSGPKLSPRSLVLPCDGGSSRWTRALRLGALAGCLL
ncbi:MAG: hypothetical protein QOE17_469, partial [Gaiellales bacterium]|nr:hypothetical protein [Gaiellales bacterium]